LRGSHRAGALYWLFTTGGSIPPMTKKLPPRIAPGRHARHEEPALQGSPPLAPGGAAREAWLKWMDTASNSEAVISIVQRLERPALARVVFSALRRSERGSGVLPSGDPEKVVERPGGVGAC
jgi:hypothetical protein